MKICIIGYGRFGPHHARVFRQLGCEVSVYDQSPEQVRSAAEAGFEVFDVMPRNLNAIVVATPASAHKYCVEWGLTHGMHVLCEKPLAKSYQEAYDFENLAEDNHLVLMTGYTYLSHPVYDVFQGALKDRMIGEPWFFRAERENLGILRMDADVVEDLMVHDIAFANALFGEPADICGSGHYHLGALPEAAEAAMAYPMDITASFFASWLGPTKRHRILLVGSLGSLEWNESDPHVVLHESHLSGHGRVVNGGHRLIGLSADEPLLRQARRFLGAIQREPWAFEGNFSSSVVQVTDRIRESIDESVRS